MAEVLREAVLRNGTVLQVVRGNLVEEQVDAIVNAANEKLVHGGGVAGAIVRAGGEVIQEESERVAPVATGSCAVTGAGALPCRYVIHAVGPIYKGVPSDDVLLAAACASALAAASELGLESVSMPAVSSGIFGFPKDRCAAILTREVMRFLERDPGSVRIVRLCNIDQPTADAFVAAFDAVSSGGPTTPTNRG